MDQPKIGVVLAAGKGTRLKSDLPKVLHKVLGKSMLERLLENLATLELDKVIIIVGHQAQSVIDAVSTMILSFPVEFVIQEPQLGTGHAMMQLLSVLPSETDAEVLVTCADMPLIPSHRYRTLLENHAEAKTVVTLAAVSSENPTGYGRIIIEKGQFLPHPNPLPQWGRGSTLFRRIVEEKDATAEEKKIQLVNAGIYAARWNIFSGCFSKLSQNNIQKEFYLTDAMEILAKEFGEGGVSVSIWPMVDEILGINSRRHIAEACTILSRWRVEQLMDEGVTFINPESTIVAPEVKIASDTVIYPGCYLEGEVTIGSQSEIGPNTLMRGRINIGNNCKVVQSYLERAVSVGHNAYIGPFAHIRDNVLIGEQVRIGNFVEIKEARFGSRSNAAHLCYLGDVDVGDEVNMGAGSIVANYDPVLDKKYRTVIEDGVKVGCNSVLVAPVEVKERSSVAAGSVITKNVSPWDLAIARSRQTSIPRWVEKKLAQKQEKEVSSMQKI